MKKMLIALMVGLLGATFAVAEENGAFIGVGVARSSVDISYESYYNDTVSAIGIPIILGTKRFFTQNFGIRFGGIIDMIDISSQSDENEPRWRAGGVDAFVDALFNFLSFEKADVGVFGGVSLGWAFYSNKAWGRYANASGTWDNKVSGVDVGLNVGVRANLFSHHGVEVYYRRTFMDAKGEYSDGSTIKFKRPSLIGVRYIYSF